MTMKIYVCEYKVVLEIKKVVLDIICKYGNIINKKAFQVNIVI